jgi:hypothetical protein
MSRLTYPRKKPTAATARFLFGGNSIMAGVGASDAAHFWVAVLATLATLGGTGVTVLNRAVSGQSIAVDAGSGTMMATGPSLIDASLSSTADNIHVVSEGTNEIKGIWLRDNVFNPQLAFDNLKAYCLARRAAATAAGKKLFLVVGTTIPAGETASGQGQAWVNGRNAAFITYNNLIRANISTFADLLWDVALEEPFRTMFANGDFSSAAFTNTGLWVAGDLTHPVNAGHAALAASCDRAMRRIRAAH